MNNGVLFLIFLFNLNNIIQIINYPRDTLSLEEKGWGRRHMYLLKCNPLYQSNFSRTKVAIVNKI